MQSNRKLKFDGQVTETEWKVEFVLVGLVKPALKSSDPVWKTMSTCLVGMLKNVLLTILELDSQFSCENQCSDIKKFLSRISTCAWNSVLLELEHFDASAFVQIFRELT